MKYFFSLFFFLALSAGCKEKKTSEAELENKLMKTMTDYLAKNANPGVAVNVKDVLFYDKKDYYYCEFRVNMHSVNKDTTGTMVAIISHDFSKVERSQ
jgi:hypothetical protein